MATIDPDERKQRRDAMTPALKKKVATSSPADAVAKMEQEDWPSTSDYLQAQGVVTEGEEQAGFKQLYATCQRWTKAILENSAPDQDAYHLANLTRFLFDRGENNDCLYFWRAVAYQGQGQLSFAADILLGAPETAQSAYANELIGMLEDAGRSEDAARIRAKLGKR